MLCVCVKSRSDERCRERWIRWWSENPELLRVVVMLCEGAPWWGSWMAKWSIDEREVCEVGLKVGGRWVVRQV